MTDKDRVFMPAAVVPSYQNSFIREVAKLDERPLAFYIRLAFDLLIAHIRKTEPRLFERAIRTLSEDERTALEKAANGEPPPDNHETIPL